MEVRSLWNRLADRYAHRPLIAFWLLHPWFVLTLVVLGALAAGLLLANLRLWPATPPGYEPALRISGIDRVRAERHARAARQAAFAGHHEEATRAWALACRSHPGSLPLLREALEHARTAPDLRPAAVQQTGRQATRLLHLGQTNRADLTLALLLADTLHLPEAVLHLAQPLSTNLAPAEEAACQRALFLTGRALEFRQRQDHTSTPLDSDLGLALCRLAYDAGWEPSGNAPQAQRTLIAKFNDPTLGPLAARILMVLATRRVDPTAYRQALNHLELHHLDRPSDHIHLWRLLAANQRTDEARRLAQDYAHHPVSALDTTLIAQAMLDFDLGRDAEQLLHRHANQHADEASPEAVRLWMTYGEILIRNQRWDHALALAVELRSTVAPRAALLGYSHWLEGRALHGRGQRESATAPFQRAVEFGMPFPENATPTAREFLRLGYPGLALRLLEPLEPQLGEQFAYWQSLFDAVYADKTDADLLLRAALKARNLEPARLETLFNVAAALLITRRDPEEAAAVTLDTLRRFPDSLPARVNHSFALVQNRRVDEAARLLASIHPPALSALESSVFHLCAFEVHFLQGETARCREDLTRIDRQHLFPGQIRWLDQMAGRLSAETGDQDKKGGPPAGDPPK